MLSDPIIKKEITKAYGTGTEKMADFIREYNNNLINFIFQNYISYFYNQKGEFINIPEVYDTLPVVIDDNIETDVEVLSDKIKVNSKLIEFDYATKSFLNTNDTEFGYAQRGLTTFNKLNNPFQNLPQFYRYVISREVLAKKNSPESLRDDSHFLTLLANNNNNPRAAYEDYISERALLNSFNRSYIMGKTKFSYTEDLLQIISELENNSALKDRFPILGQLSRLPNKDGFKIIRLNNRRDVKGDAAQEYKRQITQLADPTVKKLDNPNNDPIIASKEKRLTELFSVFSLMMYYQHGVGKTATGFTNVLDSSQYISTMRDASEAFMGNYIYNNSSEGVLNIIFNISKSKKKFKNLNSQANRYIHTEYAEIEEEVNNTQANEFVLEFDLEEGLKNETSEFKPGERLISETDVDRFKKLFAKLGTKPETFFTEDTKFSKFYNGRKQGMPQSAGWYLNEATGLYDMIDQDPDSGEVYYQNVDLLTGLQMIKEGEGATQPTGGVAIVSVADIPQNKVSGVESFGSIVTANAESIRALGANPHSIDMIEAGLRTRTTRSESEMAKYAVKVGDTIKHFGKSADGTTKTILAKVTAIHPKGTPGFKGTWNKEGWREQDVNVIDRFKDGAAAIEFEVIQPSTQPTETGGEKSSISDDMAEYTKLVEQNKGVQPKTFTVGTRTWTLNKFGNYDWADPTSGQIYMRNVDMETGESIPEPALNEPVNPELIQKDLEYIDSIRKALELDIKFAELGYDLNDLIKRLASAKTMKEYNDVQEIFNKLC
jgi:hypothetical protein